MSTDSLEQAAREVAVTVKTLVLVESHRSTSEGLTDMIAAILVEFARAVQATVEAERLATTSVAEEVVSDDIDTSGRQQDHYGSLE